MSIENCKYCARSCLYWVGMNKDIEVMNKCQICVRYGNTNTKEPLECFEVPDKPWEVVGTDLFYFHGKNYVMIVYYFLKFVEFVMIPTSTSSKLVTQLIQSKVISLGMGYLILLDMTAVLNTD